MIYTITFCEKDTGIILNQDGSRWSKLENEKMYQPSFKTVDEALTLKHRLLSAFPSGEVMIEDETGNRNVFHNEKG